MHGNDALKKIYRSNSKSNLRSVDAQRFAPLIPPTKKPSRRSDKRGQPAHLTPLFYHGGGADDVNMTITYYVNVVFLDGHVSFCVHPDDYDETQDGVLESGKKVCVFPVLY